MDLKGLSLSQSKPDFPSSAKSNSSLNPLLSEKIYLVRTKFCALSNK